MRKALALAIVLATATGCSEPEGDDSWYGLDLILSQGNVVAGTSVTYTAELVGLQGQRLATEVELESDLEPTLTHSSTALTPQVIGEHNLTATATVDGETFTDRATLVVTTGEPAAIRVSLSDETPNVGLTVTVSAEILDTFGNPVEASWTLSVTAEEGSDAESVLVEGHSMTFSEEGEFTAVGTVDDTDLSDSVGPFVVGGMPPEIVIANPERGAWRTTYENTVSGTVEDEFGEIGQVTVNGIPVSVSESGEFSHDVIYRFGMNEVETLATDDGGNTSADRRAVLAGSFVPNDEGIGDGVVVRLNEGTLDALATAAEGKIAEYDIIAAIPDPMVDRERESCPLGLCFTTYALRLWVTAASIGSVDIALDPVSAGYIIATVAANDVALDWSADGVLTEIGYTTHGTVTADSITLTMRLTPTVGDEQIHIVTSEVTVTSENFVFDWDSWVADVADTFGLDLSNTVQGYAEEAIQEAVVEEVPPAIEEALQGLELANSYERMGNTYTLSGVPDDISVDDAGLTVSLETQVFAEEWQVEDAGLGSLYQSYSVPVYSADSALVVSFSGDFLNQTLYSYWGGGLLDRQLELEALGLDPSILQLVLAELADTQVIVVHPLLPAISLPSSGEAMAEIQMGDVEVAMYRGDPADASNLLMLAYAGFEADLDFEVTEEGTLSASIEVGDVWCDVAYPHVPLDVDDAAAALMAPMVGVLAGELDNALGATPIPEVTGFQLVGVTVEPAGVDRGYLNVSGELERLPDETP